MAKLVVGKKEGDRCTLSFLSNVGRKLNCLFAREWNGMERTKLWERKEAKKGESYVYEYLFSFITFSAKFEFLLSYLQHLHSTYIYVTLG